jgi:hypothetical protein
MHEQVKADLDIADKVVRAVWGNFVATEPTYVLRDLIVIELVKARSAEREACARIASGSDMSADCDSRGATDMETGEVPCSAEARGEVCVCAERSELAHKIAAKIRARAVS